MNGNMLSGFHLLNYTLSLQEKAKRLLLYLPNKGNQWKEVGDPVSVNYTRENSGDISGSGTTIIMSLNDNMYNERVGQVIFTQEESGKTLSVTCKQGKKKLREI